MSRPRVVLNRWRLPSAGTRWKTARLTSRSRAKFTQLLDQHLFRSRPALGAKVLRTQRPSCNFPVEECLALASDHREGGTNSAIIGARIQAQADNNIWNTAANGTIVTVLATAELRAAGEVRVERAFASGTASIRIARSSEGRLYPRAVSFAVMNAARLALKAAASSTKGQWPLLAKRATEAFCISAADALAASTGA